MKYEKRYLYYSILPCCLLLIVIGIYVFGYNPPTQNPPFGNLPAPINAGPDSQTKKGDLIVEGDFTTKGILKLGQFATANLPAGAEGALCFDTTKNAMQIYVSNAWRDLIVSKLGLGETCNLDGDCDLGHCVDGVCCNASCEGTCNRCNVAGSLGTCIESPSDCAGGCSICSSGNCIADPTKCTGNCVQCTGSGATYSCSANNALCTGNCSFCTGSGTVYNCAGSNGFCSNTTSSCNCSGTGTVFNCQSCPDTYGVCGYPTCSGYTCGNGYDNGVACSTCHTCSSGACTVHVAAGNTGLNCTATHYRCDGGGNCTAPGSGTYTRKAVFLANTNPGPTCSTVCADNDYHSCYGMEAWLYGNLQPICDWMCTTYTLTYFGTPSGHTCGCACYPWLY